MRHSAAALLLPALIAVIPIVPAAAAPPPRSEITCYTAWDANFLYVAAVVRKPTIKAGQSAPFSDVRSDDSVAIFAERTATGAARTAQSVEMVVSAAGGGQLYRGASATPLAGFQDFLKGPDGDPQPFKYGAAVRTEPASASDKRSAYTVEVAIPWVELGGPPATGSRLRFNVVAQSAAPDTSPIISASNGVKTAADIENPSLWSEIVFVDAPVRTVASAPDAHVCARVLAARPVMDGAIGVGEWQTLTAFSFMEAEGGGSAPILTSVAAARTRPVVELKRARPPIVTPAASPKTPPPHRPQALPHLTLGGYGFDYQADPRKSAAGLRPVGPDGASTLLTHPADGAGPWMSYDSTRWHRDTLLQMRDAGIDVALPIYRADAAGRASFGLRGLTVLARALRSLESSERDYPTVGMWLDTSSLGSAAAPLDLSGAAGRSRLYAAVREFFLQIPPAFRAAVPLTAENGGISANILVLDSQEALVGLDVTALQDLRGRFIADFGADLLVLGGAGFPALSGLDGLLDLRRISGFQVLEGGWVRCAAIGAGPAAPEGSPPASALFYRASSAYRDSWKKAVAARPAWVFAGVFNDFVRGAEIAPSAEYGLEYTDLTRIFSQAHAGAGAIRASIIHHTVPSTAVAGTKIALSVRIINRGGEPWAPDRTALSVVWVGPSGKPVGEPTLTPLPAMVIPGGSVTVRASVAAPAAPGAYALVADMAQLGKKGSVTAFFAGLGSAPLSAAVSVLKPDGPAQHFASVSRTDLPTTVEAGGTYRAGVTLRNDGSRPWPRTGARVLARVWRYVSPVNATGEAESWQPVEMADAGADLPADVAPGQETSVTLPITFSRSDGAPLAAWSPTDNWNYQIRYEVSLDEAGATGAITPPEPIAIVDADLGVEFTATTVPAQLPGDKRMPFRISLRNRGPQTWKKDLIRVGCHWYYDDGSEAVWEDETTGIPQDVQPGGEIRDMLVWTTPPPGEGPHWMVWDVKLGDTWASTLPSFAPAESVVQRPTIVMGRMSCLNLDGFFSVAGATGPEPGATGDLDGSGRALPAEILPPFSGRDPAPATLWLPSAGTGLDSSRRIPFRFGPKGEGARNAVQCSGQRLQFAPSKSAAPVRRVHILAASTRPGASIAATLVFVDGSEQLTSFPVSAWDAAPANGEQVAFAFPYTRTRGAKVPGPAVSLFRYAVKTPDAKKLAAIVLPRAPEVRILAITLER